MKKTQISFLISTCLFLSACATVPPTDIPLPTHAVQPGPVIELLNERSIHDVVKIVPESENQVHVLIASTELKQVIDVVVRPEGVVQSRIIRSNISPSALDGAFDKNGKLHALIDTEHWVLLGEKWQFSCDTPWQRAGITAQEARFIPGGSDLIWSFTVNGEALGAPGRWDWYAIGGYGGGILWPWHQHGKKLMIAPGSSISGSGWMVLDRTDKSDVDYWISTAQDNVEIVYVVSRSSFGASAEERYVNFKIDDFLHGSTLNSLDTSVLRDRIPIRDVSGHSIKASEVDNRSSILLLAARQSDARTGLFSMQWIMSRNGNTLHCLKIGKPRDIWSGKGFPVLYATFTRKGWSSTIQVGLADTGSFWGSIWKALDIRTLKNGTTFLVWPMKHQLVGRWIRQETGE